MKKINFNNWKYVVLIPVVLALLAVIIGVIFGFNHDYDFRKVSNFTVKFNTTVSAEEYESLEDGLKATIKDAGVRDFRMERVGSGADNGILVRIANDDGMLDGTIETLKTTIEESLLSSVSGIESSVVVSTTDIGYSLPKNVTNLVLFSLLAFGCILVLVFFYNFIRYNLIAGCALPLGILLSVVTLLSMLIIFRVPLNYYFMVPFFVMVLGIIVSTTFINNQIKSTLQNEAYAKSTNNDRVLQVVSNQWKPIVIAHSAIAIVVLATMFFGGASLIYFGIAQILGLVVSALTSIFVCPTFWTIWYKKDKDRMLQRRIENQKKKEAKKPGEDVDDKIVV